VFFGVSRGPNGIPHWFLIKNRYRRTGSGSMFRPVNSCEEDRKEVRRKGKAPRETNKEIKHDRLISGDANFRQIQASPLPCLRGVVE
jgi:hypothetical protein